jgi:arginyl-tRNA synthetase
MEQRFGPIPEKDRAQVEGMITGIIKGKIDALQDENEIKELSSNYESSVKQVAHINPFLAYSLAGQSTRLQRLGMLGDYFDSIKELFDTEEEHKAIKDLLGNYTEEKIILEIIKDIKESILEVSKRIGYLKYLRARKFFIKSEKDLIEDMDEEVNAIVDQIEEQIKKHSN